jgi:hypothetical protein
VPLTHVRGSVESVGYRTQKWSSYFPGCVDKSFQKAQNLIKAQILNMKNNLLLTTVVSIFALSGFANAQAVVGSGTMGVTAQVVGTINLSFITDGAGMTVGGTGTAAGTLAFGNVQMFGAAPVTNLTQTVNGTTAFTISTPIDIRADLSNTTSPSFTLAATLTTPDAVNTWTLGGVNISSGAATTIAAAAAYATNTPYVLALTIPATETAALITNIINFTATSN